MPTIGYYVPRLVTQPGTGVYTKQERIGDVDFKHSEKCYACVTSDEILPAIDTVHISKHDERSILQIRQEALYSTNKDWLVFWHGDVVNPPTNLHFGDCLQEDVLFVSPWTNKSLPMIPSMSYEEMKRRCQNSGYSYQEMVFPVTDFHVLNVKLAKQLGGFDREAFGPGYGEVADLAMQGLKVGMRCLRSMRDYVFLPGKEREDYGWGVTGIEPGTKRFVNKWGMDDILSVWEKHYKWNRGFFERVLNQHIHLPSVAWYFYEAPICGAVLHATHISNHLNYFEANSFLVSTIMPPEHKKLMTMTSSPLICRDQVELSRFMKERMGKRDFVVAPLSLTIEDVYDVCRETKATPINYVQDDERRFLHSGGIPYAPKEEIEARWKMLPNVGANSKWVQKAVQDVIEGDVELIHVGVDLDKFKPGKKTPKGYTVKIMVHCRPSTPRRGWDFVSRVMNRLSLSSQFFLITYDEEPVGLNVPNHKHYGKLSPDEVAKLMSTADIFFEGSEFQGFGMQSLEALASGCSLVSTRNHGVNEYGIDRTNCILVDHGGVESAVGVLCQLIDDENIRNALGKNARKTVEEFSWREIGVQWENWLMKLRRSRDG